MHSTCSSILMCCNLCFKTEEIQFGKRIVKEHLKKQEKEMKLNLDKNFPPVSDGVTVRVPIHADSRNVLPVAMSVRDDGF